MTHLAEVTAGKDLDVEYMELVLENFGGAEGTHVP
jgi:hypothetical protein